MMNSDTKKRARETIDIITAKLDPGLLQSLFDRPIFKAAGEFKCEAECPVTHKALHKIVADFVQQIYEKALKASLMLTDPLAEAIFMLTNYYQSVEYGTGYEAAILDANDPAQGGIWTTLTGMAEAIKNIERKKYIEAVFVWHLHSCSWELLCEIARLLLEDYRPFIPAQLGKCVPAQLIDEIQSIMYENICSDFTLQQISSCNEKHLTAETLLDSEIP